MNEEEMGGTLVIVHLSSMASYVHESGIAAAHTLCDHLYAAMMTHKGPVVIMDQGMEYADPPLERLDDTWKETLRVAKELHDRVLACAHPNLTVFHHDEMEDISPWQEGMKNLARVLRRLNPTSNRVRIGGFWTSQDGATGCVHETAFQLKMRRFRCQIDHRICAMEKDEEEGRG